MFRDDVRFMCLQRQTSSWHNTYLRFTVLERRVAARHVALGSVKNRLHAASNIGLTRASRQKKRTPISDAVQRDALRPEPQVKSWMVEFLNGWFKVVPTTTTRMKI